MVFTLKNVSVSREVERFIQVTRIVIIYQTSSSTAALDGAAIKILGLGVPGGLFALNRAKICGTIAAIVRDFPEPGGPCKIERNVQSVIFN